MNNPEYFAFENHKIFKKAIELIWILIKYNITHDLLQLLPLTEITVINTLHLLE